MHWHRYDDPEAPLTRHYGHGKSYEQRFWEKVEKTDGCWQWTGACNDKGYGQLSIGARIIYAHRFSWEWHYGPIHRRLDIDHTCFSHGCVNPGHLRPATRKQNMENLPGLQKNNTSGVRGVWWDKARDRWIARVNHNQRPVHVGRFVRLEDAEAAVLAKRLELFTHNDLDRR